MRGFSQNAITFGGGRESGIPASTTGLAVAEGGPRPRPEGRHRAQLGTVVGGAGRLEFSVIGDAVNTAARVESATRRDEPLLQS